MGVLQVGNMIEDGIGLTNQVIIILLAIIAYSPCSPGDFKHFVVFLYFLHY